MYKIEIDGRPVNYLKRVKYGAPFVLFAYKETEIAKYDERAAKGWYRTCKAYFGDDVKMLPV